MQHCSHSGFCNAEVAQQFIRLAEKVIGGLPVGTFPELTRLAYDALEAFEKADQAPHVEPTLADIDAKLESIARGIAGLYG